MKCQKGSASVELVILATVLIAFIVLPLLSLAIERVMILYSINVVVEAMESTLYSSSTSMDMQALSEGEIQYDMVSMEADFQKVLKEKLRDLVIVNVVTLEFYSAESLDIPCRLGERLAHNTLHVTLDIHYEHKLYRYIISDELKRSVKFHFDLELPQNR